MTKPIATLAITLSCTHAMKRKGPIPLPVLRHIFNHLTWFCHFCGYEKTIRCIQYIPALESTTFRYSYPDLFESELADNHWDIWDLQIPIHFKPKPPGMKD